MTNRLVIHLPHSGAIITLDSDKSEAVATLSDFCKEELGAYHATENSEELTVDNMSHEQANQLHSLLFKLGLL